MRRLFYAAAVALLCVCTAAAHAVGLAANPTLLPKTLMALRGEQGDRTQLQLVFDRSRDGQAAKPLTVWLGADYFATVDGTRLNITDLGLQRRFVVDRQDGSLVNLSLYGDVMFRRIEVLRRQQIAAALAKEASHPDMPQGLRRFWIESEARHHGHREAADGGTETGWRDDTVPLARGRGCRHRAGGHRDPGRARP